MWFSSDNGPENKTPGTTGGLKARKRSLHEGGVRVPGLLTWPKKLGPRTVEAPCHTGDYYPTVLAALDETTGNQTLDGIDLWPVIMGDRSGREGVIHFRYGAQATVIGDRYKLYRAKDKDSWSLYDLVSDRSEQTDIAAQKPEVLAKLKSSFEAWSLGLAP